MLHHPTEFDLIRLCELSVFQLKRKRLALRRCFKKSSYRYQKFIMPLNHASGSGSEAPFSTQTSAFA